MRRWPDVRAKLRWHPVARVWVYTVQAPVFGSTGTFTVLTDHTGSDPRKIPPGLFDQAAHDASVVRRMLLAGHRFYESWSGVMERHTS